MRAARETFFQNSPQAHFDTEEMFAAGDRCVVRWRYTWVKNGVRGHVRGVDVFRVRAGKVSEKLSYVKRLSGRSDYESVVRLVARRGTKIGSERESVSGRVFMRLS